MKRRKVISRKNLPDRPPLVATVTAWLAMDRIHPPGWLWGAVGAIFLVLWMLTFVGIYHQDEIEIFPEEK